MPGERHDERLDLEVVDDRSPCESPNAAPIGQHDRGTPASGGQPWPARSSRAEQVDSATTEPTERSMPPVRMTNVIPTTGDEQERVVDEQVEEHLPVREVRVADAPEREHRHDEAEGDQHRDVPRAATRRADVPRAEIPASTVLMRVPPPAARGGRSPGGRLTRLRSALPAAGRPSPGTRATARGRRA